MLCVTIETFRYLVYANKAPRFESKTGVLFVVLEVVSQFQVEKYHLVFVQALVVKEVEAYRISVIHKENGVYTYCSTTSSPFLLEFGNQNSR